MSITASTLPTTSRVATSLIGSETASFHKSTWFGALPPHLQRALLTHSTVWNVPARRAVCEQGTTPDVWFGLASGAIKLSSVNLRGIETLVDVIEPGHWFGDTSLLHALPQPFAAYTLAPSVVLVMRRSMLQEILVHHPEMRTALTKLSWISTTRLTERLRLLAVKTLEMRTKEYLKVLSDRFGTAAPSTAETPMCLTQTDWGAVLGVGRQHANGVLQRLERSGVVKLERGRVIAFAQTL